jgi:hypothetical protein
MGKHALLHPDQEDHRELEPLGGMRGHERYALAPELCLIHVGDQRDLVQEELERRAVFEVCVGGLEVLGSRDELTEVLETRLGFGRALTFEVVEIAAALQQKCERARGQRLAHFREQTLEKREEALHAGGNAPQLARLGGSGEPLEQGYTLLCRVDDGLFDRRAADSPGRCVDDATERHVVRRVHGETQVGERILHLGPVVEAHAPDHHVGNVVLEELLLEGSRLGVGAIEDRALAEGAALSPHGVEDAPHGVLRLVALVGSLVEADGVASAAFGDEALLLAGLVVSDHARGAVEDGSGGAVVPLETDHARLGMVLLEVEDVADVGTPPGVDRLVGIPYHAEVAVLPGQLVDQPVLHAVRVLVLVHQHVLPAPAIVVEDLGEAIEELGGLDQQIAEVEGVGVGEEPLIGGIELHRLLCFQILCALGDLGGQVPFVLPLVDAPAHPLRLVDLRVETVAPLGLLDHGQRVGLVVDHETPREAEVPGLPAQDPDTR